jgi:hypothetical protein
MNSLSLSTLDWLIGGGALVVNILAGLWLAMRARQSGSSDEFFLAGRRLTWPIVGASLLATNIGAEHIVGLCGDAYRYGFCAGAIELTAGVSIGIAVAILVPYYLKNRVFTIPEFLELRYRKEARLFFSAMMLVICVVTKMAFCLYAGALVLKGVLGWEIMPTVIALAATTAVITMIGGFAAVAYTDAIHAPIMILGSAAVLFIGLSKVGGWDALCAAAAHTPVPDAMHIHKPYTDHLHLPGDAHGPGDRLRHHEQARHFCRCGGLGGGGPGVGHHVRHQRDDDVRSGRPLFPLAALSAHLQLCLSRSLGHADRHGGSVLRFGRHETHGGREIGPDHHRLGRPAGAVPRPDRLAIAVCDPDGRNCPGLLVVLVILGNRREEKERPTMRSMAFCTHI